MGKDHDCSGDSNCGGRYGYGCGETTNPASGVEGWESRKPCFPASTLIETPSGQAALGKLSEGDMVLSYSRGALVPRRITRKLVHKPAKLVTVEFETGGTALVCTSSHSFLSNRGYQSLEKLHAGDSIMRVGPSGIEERRIGSITPTGMLKPVFNLYTEGEHNFIADGCVAHNFTNLRMLRVVMHKLLFDSLTSWKGKPLLAPHA